MADSPLIGEEPIALGCLTDHPGVIGLGSLAIGVVAMANLPTFGWVILLGSALLGAHDVHHHHRKAMGLLPPAPESLALPGEPEPPTIDVPAVAAAPPAPKPQTPTVQPTTAAAVAVDLAESLAQPLDESIALDLKSMLVVGQPGAGKGKLMERAIAAVKRHRPEVTIWAIDPKADPNEAGYWAQCDRYLAHGIPAFPKQVDIEAFTVAADRLIEEFRAAPAPKLLIVDEGLALKELTGAWFGALTKGFNHLCSTGRSLGIYGWAISQSPNATDWGMSGGMRNVYRRIILIHQQDLGLIQNGSTFFSGAPSDKDFSVSGRAYFDSLANSWGPVPVYSVPGKPQTKPKNIARRRRRVTITH